MKNFIKSGLLLMMVALVSSCNCYTKMHRNFDKVRVTCTPEVLTLKGGAVEADYTLEFPANYFNKKAVLKVTPVIVGSNGKEMIGTPVFIQGEKVKENYQVVSYKNGGTVTEKVSFPYDADLNLSTLKLVIESKCSKCGKVGRHFNPFATINAADGTSTIQALAVRNAKLAFAPDGFKRTSQISKEAKIMFLINRSEVRTEQLNSNDVKALEDFIKANTGDAKKTVSDIYVKSYASPEGPVALNNKLSADRGKNTKTAVSKKYTKDQVNNKFDVEALGEDWEGFKALVESSNIQDKELILQVLKMYSDPQRRDSEIKNMTAAFQVLAEKVLPELRRSRMIVNVDVQGLTDAELREAVMKNLKDLKLEEMLFAATLFNDTDTKAKIYKAAADKYNDYKAWNNLGCVNVEQGDYAKAMENFAKAGRLNSSSPEVANNMGVVSLANGQTNEARKYLSSVNTPEAKHNMGLVNLCSGNYAEAVRTLDGFNLAVAEACSGNYGKAKQVLAGDNSAHADYLKAVIAAKEGQTSAVMSNLKSAVAKQPAYKAQAKNNVDFKKYFADSDFKAIVE